MRKIRRRYVGDTLAYRDCLQALSLEYFKSLIAYTGPQSLHRTSLGVLHEYL